MVQEKKQTNICLICIEELILQVSLHKVWMGHLYQEVTGLSSIGNPLANNYSRLLLRCEFKSRCGH